jgi:hypothetical protein
LARTATLGLLHRAGLHWLWFIFALNWTTSLSVSLAYLPFALLIWGLRRCALPPCARGGAAASSPRTRPDRGISSPGAQIRAPP